MSQTPELSGAKRALLEKYLRGELTQAARTVGIITGRAQESPPPSMDSRVSLVPVQTSGSKRPFFYFHVHWAGGAFYCITLAFDLGEDQPFYLLEPYKFEGLGVPATIEAMAADYIKTIRTVQPAGPYLLGGFCGGCLIATEIARQLRAQREEVDLLALIEPGLTGRMVPMLERRGPIILRMAGGFIRGIGNLLRLVPHKQLDWFLYLRHMYRVMRYRDLHLPLNPTSEFLRQDWMGIYVWSVSAYRSVRYPGKITYFWASEETDSRRLAWDIVVRAEESEIIMIPGTHDSCRSEHIHDLAKQLRTCLDKVKASYQHQYMLE